MAFTVKHTQAYSGVSDTHTFMTYFFGTYLSGKDDWTVNAHPSGDAGKYSVKLELPTPLQGSDHKSYLWVDSRADSTDHWKWYDDARYSSTPGDTGDDTTNVVSNSTNFTDVSGKWRIWESGVNDQCWMVTKGKHVFGFWPGSTKSFGMNDPNWDGSYDNHGTTLFPYVDNGDSALGICNFPLGSGASTTEFDIIPAVNYYDTEDLGLGSTLIHSFSWWATGTSQAPGAATMPILSPGPSDVLWYTNFTGTSASRKFLYNSWNVVNDTTASKYYLIGTSDTDKQAMAFDMGSSEPDFS
ncbi:MAG: hypothetical protein VXX44_01110 [Bacteroidota bacterium]|nr:hypothetical protein [Bacteroidota bacterium]